MTDRSTAVDSASGAASRAPAAEPGLPPRRILLRGLAREAGHWHEMPDRLRAADPRSEVLTPDLPGAGAASGWRSPWTVEGIAANVAARVHLELSGAGAAGGAGAEAAGDASADPDEAVDPPPAQPERPIHLIGHSLGGMVALAWAALKLKPVPDLVIVSCPSAADLGPPWQRLRPTVLPGLLHVAIERDPRDRESEILGLTSTIDGKRRIEVLDARAEIAAERPMRTATAFRQLAAAARFHAPSAERIEMPVVVIGSEGDRFVAPACSRALAERYGAALHLHPSAGHDVPLDDPQWFVRTVIAAADAVEASGDAAP